MQAPYALAHYQQRGFHIYKEEVSYPDLPEVFPGKRDAEGV